MESMGIVTSAWFLSMVPPLDLMRLPHRWYAVVTLGLALLASRGAAALPRLAAVLVFLDVFLFYSPSVQTVRITPPGIISSYTGPVLELPPRLDGLRGRYLVWQRSHRQPVPYALLMKGWSDEFSDEPLLVAAAAMDSLDTLSIKQREAMQFRQGRFAASVIQFQRSVDYASLKGARERLRKQGVEQVCLHVSQMLPADALLLQRLLEELLGTPQTETEEALLWTL